jgi:branched-chain amino acid transport system permease protein
LTLDCGVSFTLATGLFLMRRSTDFGRSIHTVHQNAHAAASIGIDVGRVQLLTFAPGIKIARDCGNPTTAGQANSAHGG